MSPSYTSPDGKNCTSSRCDFMWHAPECAANRRRGSRRAAALALAAMLIVPSLALATGKPEEPKKETPTQVQDQAQGQSQKTSSKAKAAAASKSTAKASARQEQGVEIVDESTSDDHSTVTYQAEKQVAATAASLEAAYCSGGGFSAQTRGAGVSATGRSSFCEMLEGAKLHLEIASAYFEAAEALRAATSKGPTGGGTLAQDAVVRGLAEVAQAHELLQTMKRRTQETDTAVRRANAKFFGSLPFPLSLMAPRD